jgi:murein DD-endopeptidase MepM/ murein hydrolase activator NlpD
MGLRKRERWGAPWLSLPLSGLLAVVVALFAPWDEPTGVAPTRLESAALDPQRALRDISGSQAEARRPPTSNGELRSGETLGGILTGLGLSGIDAHRAAEASSVLIDLRQLRPGTLWSAWADDEDRIERFELALPDRGELRLERTDEGFEASLREYERETRYRTLHGRLDGSLEASIERAGGDPALAYAMAEVLQWDLDFTRDLRTDDEFRLLYEELWVEGEPQGAGRILALRYGQEDGRSWEAYEFDGQGYYDEQGRPLQKMFLRSPMPYSRVTSRFSNRRFHPVLKVFRPHHGVDYGAPVGTPVRVTASGSVTFAGWDGGGGRTIKVRHPNQYVTCYLHLSRFARGIGAGARVRQGDVIGYVGSTGLATGPHLDYRVQLAGRWIDPLSLASVPAEPLSPTRLAGFLTARSGMRESLDTGRPYLPPVLVAEEAPARVAAATEAPVRTR